MPEVEFQRPSRKLSAFLGREMLFDYYSKRLDPNRRQALEELLREHPELRIELQQIENADEYCRKLSATKVSLKHIQDLQRVRPWARILFERTKFKNWPDPLRWGAEAMAISIIAVAIAVAVPWQKIRFSFPKQPAGQVVQNQKANPVVTTTTTKVDSAKPTEAKSVETKPIETKQVTAAVAAAPVAPKPQQAPLNPTRQERVIPVQGLLYQISMRVDNDPKISAAVKTKIESLGGEKAGQVALGWRKVEPSGSYFHFTISEGNYPEILKTLGEYGPVRIYKNPHPRVMPPGQIRIILWLEDKVQPGPSEKSAVEPVAPNTEANESAESSQGQ